MKFNCRTPKELLKKIKGLDIKMVDLRFTDLPGSTHHISIPIKYLKEDLFNSKKLLKKSIIIKEILDKPLAIRD